MAIEFQMPKLGLTMEEGSIIEWLVADGTDVEQGTAVLTIETDKVASDVEASGSGVLHITGLAGDTFACGERIGWFLEPGEAAPAEPTTPIAAPATPSATPHAAQSAGPAAPPRSMPADPARPAAAASSSQSARQDGSRLFASPNARRIAAWRGVDLELLSGSGPDGRIVSEDVLAAPSPGHSPTATPAAHQTARRLGVDLHDVRAVRGDRLIDRADVERHLRERAAETAPRTEPSAAADTPLAQTPSSSIALSGMRGTIASRMHTSLRDMAQLTLTMDVVMDAVVRHRAATDTARRAGFTDYVLAAVAAALVQHPIVNSQIADGGVHLLPDVNVGLAVAVPGGLVVPVVQHTDTLTLDALSVETTRLASAARSGRLTREDMDGGTFSVTALGMFGVDAFTPVINPPNTAILGVGRLRDGVRWEGGVPSRTTLLTLSLTWDHRAFDGVPAAEFAAAVRDRLEAWEATR